jgi:hypothetical protein
LAGDVPDLASLLETPQDLDELGAREPLTELARKRVQRHRTPVFRPELLQLVQNQVGEIKVAREIMSVAICLVSVVVPLILDGWFPGLLVA